MMYCPVPVPEQEHRQEGAATVQQEPADQEDVDWGHVRGQLLDLSLDIYHGAPNFPMDPKPGVIPHSTTSTLGYNMTQLVIATHQATHMDAPYHFLDEGLTVERVSLSACMGPAILADLSHKGPRQPIDIADLAPLAARIVPGARLILRTGWDSVLPEQRYFTDFPFVTLDLAKWLVGRGVTLLGMDMPTPNPTDWKEVHLILLGAGMVIVEGLCHLERVGAGPFWFCALPLRIRGRDGSPVRAIGVVAR